MSIPSLVHVENCAGEICHRGDTHLLHVGVLALGGRNNTIGIITTEEIMATRMPLPPFEKGPWRLNEERSVVRLRGLANPTSTDLNLLAIFAGAYGIGDVAVSFPGASETDIAFNRTQLVVPYLADGHDLRFATDSESLMHAATRAIGIATITGCN